MVPEYSCNTWGTESLVGKNDTGAGHLSDFVTPVGPTNNTGAAAISSGVDSGFHAGQVSSAEKASQKVED